MPTPPPRVLVTGMYRTGSTRLYNVIREALVARYAEARCDHLGAMDRLKPALSEPGPVLFKEHTFDAWVADRVRTGDVLAVASIRDPVVTMVSLCSSFGWSVEQAVGETDAAIATLESIAEHAHIYTYETATDSNPVTVQRVLAAVGLHVSMLEASRLAVRWSRRSVRRRSGAIVGESGTTWDPETLLHPGHVGAARFVDDEVLTALQRESSRLSMPSRVRALEALAT